MIVKIENPRFSYIEKNIVFVSSEVVIYADDGTTELHRKGITAKGNLHDTSVGADKNLLWKVNAKDALISQAQKIIDIYVAGMKAISSAWGAASTPEKALDFLVSEVEAKLTY